MRILLRGMGKVCASNGNVDTDLGARRLLITQPCGVRYGYGHDDELRAFTAPDTLVRDVPRPLLR